MTVLGPQKGWSAPNFYPPPVIPARAYAHLDFEACGGFPHLPFPAYPYLPSPPRSPILSHPVLSNPHWKWARFNPSKGSAGALSDIWCMLG